MQDPQKKLHTIIEANNLNFYYGYKREHALKNIHTSIPKKKLTSIIGPSGSGKSTLLRVFNTIYKINRSQHATGEVLYQGENILDKTIDPVWLRSQIGMVFQKPTPFPMSLYDNIAFPLTQLYKLTKTELNEKVIQALKDAALWDEVKDKLYETGSHLSGGQQQRLCFARTIALSPEVLLLDEPTSALDPLSKRQINKLIHKLKDSFTIIMVTHDILSAHQLSDHIIMMNQGGIVEQNDAHDFFNRPQQPFSQIYLSEYNQQGRNQSSHGKPTKKSTKDKHLNKATDTV